MSGNVSQMTKLLEYCFTVCDRLTNQQTNTHAYLVRQMTIGKLTDGEINFNGQKYKQYILGCYILVWFFFRLWEEIFKKAH